MYDITPLIILLGKVIEPMIEDAVAKAIKSSPTATLSTPSASRYLNAPDAANFLGIKLQTLYQNIEKIPHLKKHGKLHFRENELIAYMEGTTKGGQKS